MVKDQEEQKPATKQEADSSQNNQKVGSVYEIKQPDQKDI